MNAARLRPSVADFVDRRGERRTEPLSTTVPAGILLTINTVGGIIDGVLHLSANFTSVTWQVAPLLALIVASVVAVVVICQKRYASQMIADEATAIIEYSYPNSLRQPAKLALLLCIAVIPLKARTLMLDTKPLGQVIGGTLRDVRGNPLTEARLRLVTPAGQELATSASPTDAIGFYVIEAASIIHRQDVLRVAWADCNAEVEISLARSFEIGRTPRGAPLFQHVVTCNN